MSEQIKDAIKKARKIVIKIGSNTLAKSDGTQNTDFMHSFAAQVKNLIDSGKQIAVVSSGAQVSGVSAIKEWARKKDVHYRQALCAIGQVELMSQWRKAFAESGIHIGQLLFVKENFENKLQTLNTSATTTTLARSRRFCGERTCWFCSATSTAFIPTIPRQIPTQSLFKPYATSTRCERKSQSARPTLLEPAESKQSCRPRKNALPTTFR